MWQLLVFSRVLLAYVGYPWLLKKTVMLPSMKRRFFWQFSFALGFAFVFFIVSGKKFEFNPAMLILAGIAFLNNLAGFLRWKAVRISLSKVSIFTQIDDAVALLLGYWLLKEFRFLNGWLLAGIILCVLAVILLIRSKKETDNLSLLRLVVFYNVIWGIAIFAMRFFALKGISIPEFLLSWYSGTFIGALTVFILLDKKEDAVSLSRRELLNLFVLALFMWGSMVLGFWIAMLVPITVFQPIFLVSEALIPTWLGLKIFKEIRSLDKAEALAFISGIAGAIFIGLSF